MNKKLNEKVLAEQIAFLRTLITGPSVLLQNEKNRTNSVTKAYWTAMSSWERPLFVKSLRNDGYSQEEIGKMVGLSQASISRYEKFDKTNENK